MTFLLAYLLAAAIGYIGYRGHALTVGGACTACLVGGTIFGFGGLAWAALLVLFFVSSSLLSFFKAQDAGKQRAAETFDKGGTRDAWQVIANGGVAASAAFLSYFFLLTSPFFCGAFLGALGAATADTWATEIGVLSKQQPRLISTFAPVQAGTSGGVTALGTWAALAGALFIGLCAALISALPLETHLVSAPPALLLATLVGGTAGSLADSLLGATVQAGYYCPTCDRPTESRVHRCGTSTTLVHGYAWITNDLVNLAATATGAIVGGVILGMLG